MKAMLALCLTHKHVFAVFVFAWVNGPFDQLNTKDSGMEKVLLSCDVTTKVLVK